MNLCYLCALTSPENRHRATYKVECYKTEVKQTVFTCDDHYSAIVWAAFPSVTIHRVSPLVQEDSVGLG